VVVVVVKGRIGRNRTFSGLLKAEEDEAEREISADEAEGDVVDVVGDEVAAGELVGG